MVPTTPCTSRLETKKTKSISTYQENIAKVADITLEILGGHS